jgi:hypothetical protein
MKSNIKINDFMAEVKLDLLNGIYLVSLINGENKRVTNKLVIAK